MAWPRFTLRALLVIVALIGLDLATFLVAWNGGARPMAATGDLVFMSDGSVLRPSKLPLAPPFVVEPPSLMFHFRRWAPLMLAGKFTAIVGLAALIRWFRTHRDRQAQISFGDSS